MSKLIILRELFLDTKYRAEQHDFIIETKFDSERSAIQVKRKSDKAVIYRCVEDVKESKKIKKSQSDIINSQIKLYSHFISYFAFYGMWTVSESYNDAQKELDEKSKVDLNLVKGEKDDK